MASRTTFVAWVLFATGSVASAQQIPCSILPVDDIWNTPINQLPVHARSAAYIASIGAGTGLHPDFGTVWQGAPIGIPYIVVPANQPRVNVTFSYDDESDPGPYPIPSNAPIEGGASSSGDRHVLVVQQNPCMLYELYDAHKNSNGSWTAGSGAVYDLNGHALRPEGWTSADAAGLPILPGLVRYEEVVAGEINHAIRFTASHTQKAYVWPARHHASSNTSLNVPPMGQRFRLKASFDGTGFSPQVRVILRAMKRYGIILADNGSNWYISGAPNSQWDDDMLHELGQVHGSDFEAVDVSSLMADEDSGQIAQAPEVPDSPDEPEEPVVVVPISPWANLILALAISAAVLLYGRRSLGRSGFCR